MANQNSPYPRTGVIRPVRSVLRYCWQGIFGLYFGDVLFNLYQLFSAGPPVQIVTEVLKTLALPWPLGDPRTPLWLDAILLTLIISVLCSGIWADRDLWLEEKELQRRGVGPQPVPHATRRMVLTLLGWTILSGGAILLAHTQRAVPGSQGGSSTGNGSLKNDGSSTPQMSPTAAKKPALHPTARPNPTDHPNPTGQPSPTPPSTRGTVVYKFNGHPNSSAAAVAWSPDGRNIASGGLDNTVQVWNAPRGGNMRAYRNFSGSTNGVTWSPDGASIAYIASTGSTTNGVTTDTWTVEVWNVVVGTHTFSYQGQTNGVSAVAWSPNGNLIASGGNTDVQIWDVATGTVSMTYSGSGGGIVAWSMDGQLIASVGSDNIVHVWNAGTGNDISTYRGHSDAVFAISWSPDGEHIATASKDNTAQVWDSNTGAHTFTYKGPLYANGQLSGYPYDVAWSPDGNRIAYAGVDTIIRLLDASSGNTIFTYTQGGSVFGVSWSPDGRYIASAGGDVEVWQTT